MNRRKRSGNTRIIFAIPLLSCALPTALALVAGIALGSEPAAAETPNTSAQTPQPDSSGSLQEVTVTATALSVLGTGVDADKVPNTVRTLNAEDLTRGVASTFADSLQQQVGSVSLNNYEGNPYQLDLTYRGFTASPVGGTPIGIAVYEGGVRVNEGFGDVVNWDLIPTFAITSLNLTSANPVFGFNALGGAVALGMKDGFHSPGVSADVSGGSFGRHTELVQAGWHNGTWGFYLGGNLSDETGWRIDSPSHVRQWYADAGYRNEASELHLSYTGADNHLIGTGPTPANLLAVNYANSIDFPGLEWNQLNMVTLKASERFTDDWTLDGAAYYRGFSQSILNGSPSSSISCVSPLDPNTFCSPNPATGEQEQVFDRNGQSVPLSIGGAYPGDIISARTHTNTWGGTLQMTSTAHLFGHRNHFIVGGTVADNYTNYSTGTLIGSLDDSRTVLNAIPVNSVDGTNAYVGVRAHNVSASVYITNTFDVSDRLSATTSAGFNRATIRLIGLTAAALNGDDQYQRFNPSAGLTYKLTQEVTAFFNYSEDNRAPTPQELECANPTTPCIVATNFLADPPLKQVVAKTFETGLRGALATGDKGSVQWSVSLYRSEDFDDILSVPSAIILHGYYANGGNSRRQGVDLSTLYTDDHWRLGLDYSLLDATYQSYITRSSPFNPDAGAAGTINIQPGDTLPSAPRNRIKLNVDYKITPSWTVGATATYTSSQYLRGDEANLTPPLGGYAVLGLRTSYVFNDHLELYGTVDNALDRKYYTFGVYTTETGLPMPTGTTAEAITRSYGPGAPVGGWVGVRVRL
jgi:iron complex outermembrane recepter protein